MEVYWKEFEVEWARRYDLGGIYPCVGMAVFKVEFVYPGRLRCFAKLFGYEAGGCKEEHLATFWLSEHNSAAYEVGHDEFGERSHTSPPFAINVVTPVFFATEVRPARVELYIEKVLEPVPVPVTVQFEGMTLKEWTDACTTDKKRAQSVG